MLEIDGVWVVAVVEVVEVVEAEGVGEIMVRERDLTGVKREIKNNEEKI